MNDAGGEGQAGGRTLAVTQTLEERVSSILPEPLFELLFGFGFGLHLSFLGLPETGFNFLNEYKVFKQLVNGETFGKVLYGA